MIHDHLEFPFAMTVNIPLISTNIENGATEFWPGTHLRGNKGLKDERKGPWIAEKYLEERRKVRPPLRPAISKGSLIIRDFRMWHAGIANTTCEPRIMLALV
jgi:ectoine hydroxylase-related dioxygenase (phytanoyl-CoA dioxygenase family)